MNTVEATNADLFVFDDIDNDLDINEFSALESVDCKNVSDNLMTLSLDQEFKDKLNDEVLKKNVIFDLKEDEVASYEDEDDIDDNDPLDDLYYELHHKRLKKLELQDFLLNTYEIKDYLMELEEDLNTLDRDFFVAENFQMNKDSNLLAAFKEIAKTVDSICKVHNIQDAQELLEKKEKCVVHIKRMIQNYRFSKFKRSFLVKRNFKDTSNTNQYVRNFNSYRCMMSTFQKEKSKETDSAKDDTKVLESETQLNTKSKKNEECKKLDADKCAKPIIYDSIDQRYLYEDINEIVDYIDEDTATDIEEDCMVLNMASASAIKKKRLKQLHSDIGITYGKLVLNHVNKEVVIEPFRKPYIR